MVDFLVIPVTNCQIFVAVDNIADDAALLFELSKPSIDQLRGVFIVGK